MRFSAILVAAGSGVRAGGGQPKQWRPLAGRPVAWWSVRALLDAGCEDLVVVVAEDGHAMAAQALSGLVGWRTVTGGATRTQSVANGLAALAPASEVIMVHDAARPLLTPDHVRRLLDALETADGAAPALPVADTLKRAVDGVVVDTPSRDGLFRIQTPQAFRAEILRRAYDQATDSATDDAALVEAIGGRMVLIPGDPRLLKLTYPEDFDMAERMVSTPRVLRVGQGLDAHRWGPGDAVWLCGVRIDHAQTLVGHSDADAGLHAITDALLGALALGDIGDHFPPSDPRWRGASSDIFLRHALDLATEKGARLINVDVTLICEQPRIKPHRDAMRERIADILGVAISQVSVKATTTEGMGFTGRGEGLAAQAIVAVEVPAY